MRLLSFLLLFTTALVTATPSVDESTASNIVISASTEAVLSPELNTSNSSDVSADLEKRQYAPMPLWGQLPPTVLQQEVQQLRAAIAQPGTDEATLIRILTLRTPDQMKQIAFAWRKAYNSFLERAITGDTSGHFEDVLISCLWTKYEFEAKWLHWAMHGPGTNENALTEVNHMGFIR